jgi:diguanylate cyclase (GGDEF)-like protein
MVQQLWNQIRVATVEAELDEMTHVHNRRSLLNIMTALAHLASRKNFCSGLLFIDVDRFKEVNDNWGHRAGDAVLSAVARIIRSKLRRSDLVGRYGGDEFIVFLPEVQPDYAGLVADKLRVAVEQGTRNETAVTISVGVACRVVGKGVDIDADIESLIEEADRRLYQAKKDGRNRVACG